MGVGNKKKIDETLKRISAKMAAGLKEHARETAELPDGPKPEGEGGNNPHSEDVLFDPAFEAPYASKRTTKKVRDWAETKEPDDES